MASTTGNDQNHAQKRTLSFRCWFCSIWCGREIIIPDSNGTAAGRAEAMEAKLELVKEALRENKNLRVGLAIGGVVVGGFIFYKLFGSSKVTHA